MLSKLEKHTFKDEATYAKKGYRGLNIKGKIRFFYILMSNDLKLQRFMASALKKKECYVGPFIGEFGNFLLHMLPFIGFLHKTGIKVHYCGMTNHASFLIDQNGENIYHSFTSLRDFFHEVRPSGNSIDYLPADIEKQIKEFQREAIEGNAPYLDIFTNSNLYWYSFRNWQLKGRQFIYDIGKFYNDQKVKKDKVVIFPRKMSTEYTANNGGAWDYMKLANLLTQYFKEVVFVGHPSMSSDLNVDSSSTIKLALSSDNTSTLEQCASASLIVTQHSGAMHVGGYVDTPVLLIFNGKPPIRGLEDSIRFRVNFPPVETNIAFNYDEINTFCGNLSFT